MRVSAFDEIAEANSERAATDGNSELSFTFMGLFSGVIEIVNEFSLALGVVLELKTASKR